MTTRLISPVGTFETLDSSGLWLPMGTANSLGKWRSVNDFATYYYLGPGSTNPAFHTGVDLNLTLTENYDADAHAPVYVIADGIVLCARRIPNSTWGNLIVVKHLRVDSTPFYSRYAHVETMLVKENNSVQQGQMIAHVGNAFGRFPYHLHFDISAHPTWLADHPADWPGLDKAGLLARYVNPYQFMKDSIMPPQTSPSETLYVAPTVGVNLRAAPSVTATRIRTVPRGTRVLATDTTIAAGYTWRKVTLPSTSESGWMVQQVGGEVYLSSTDPTAPQSFGERYTLTRVKLRQGPSLSAATILIMDSGIKLTVTGAATSDTQYVWLPVRLASGQQGWAAEKSVDGKYELLSPDPPTLPVPVPQPPPSTKAIKVGLHIHQGSPNPVWAHDLIAQMAQTGKLAAVCVINDGGLANRLAQAGVKYVLHREVDGLENDVFYHANGIESDIQVGKDWYNSRGKHMAAYLDPRVYIQLANEANHPQDGYVWLGAMQAADADGRKLAIFGNSVGHPSDLFEGTDGKMHSVTWSMRVNSGCMRYGKAHGHVACLHQYGTVINGKETSDPGSAIWPDGHTDEVSAKWFSCRHRAIYQDIIPDDGRMLIVVGEAGPSDAVYRGWDTLRNDLTGYQTRYGNDPYIAGYCYWTVGGSGDYGFGYSTLDAALPQMAEWLRTL